MTDDENSDNESDSIEHVRANGTLCEKSITAFTQSQDLQ